MKKAMFFALASALVFACSENNDPSPLAKDDPEKGAVIIFGRCTAHEIAVESPREKDSVITLSIQIGQPQTRAPLAASILLSARMVCRAGIGRAEAR